MSLIGGAVAALTGGSVVGNAISAYMDAKAQKKALKVKRDAELEVLESERDAALASLEADSGAQQEVIRSEAQARIKAALYEADTQGQNVEISRMLGRDALNRGILDAFSFRREASQAQGSQTARLASSGVDVNTGSAAFLREELIVATDLDALAIAQNAARENYGFQVEAYAAGRQQELALLEASSTREVSEANIKGVRDTSRARAKGIRQTSKANAKAIRKVTEAGLSGISPFSSAAIAGGSTAVNFASSWYLSGKAG